MKDEIDVTQRHVMLQEDGYDPYRLPYWIRANFIMEERWGELEAEYNAAKDAVQLAEDWGVVSSPSLATALLAAVLPDCSQMPTNSAAAAFCVAALQRLWLEPAGLSASRGALVCNVLFPARLQTDAHSPTWIMCTEARYLSISILPHNQTGWNCICSSDK